MKDDFDTKIKVERFVEKLEHDMYEIKKFISFINTDDAYRKKLNKGVKQLEQKINKIKKCSTLEEVSKYIKLKKLSKDFGDGDERIRD